MLNYLLCHTYCGHMLTKLSFISRMLKIISSPIVTSLVISRTANPYKTLIYTQHYSKYFTSIISFNPRTIIIPISQLKIEAPGD